MAKADRSEMIILPTAIPMAMIRLLSSMVPTGTLIPEKIAFM